MDEGCFRHYEWATLENLLPQPAVASGRRFVVWRVAAAQPRLRIVESLLWLVASVAGHRGFSSKECCIKGALMLTPWDTCNAKSYIICCFLSSMLCRCCWGSSGYPLNVKHFGLIFLLQTEKLQDRYVLQRCRFQLRSNQLLKSLHITWLLMCRWGEYLTVHVSEHTIK